MTRTLADMAPDERQECVGMWAEVRRHLVIIAEIHERSGDAHVFRVETSDSEWHNLPDITPRLDLPRAWTPTGEPTPGEWEDAVGHVVEYADGRRDCRPRYREDSRQSALASAEELKDDGYAAMRRFITDWEPVPEDTPEPAPVQPEDVKPDPQPGEAWLIEYEGREYEAVYWYSPIYAHWAFVENRERGLRTVESPEATPVSRLVPERGDVS